MELWMVPLLVFGSDLVCGYAKRADYFNSKDTEKITSEYHSFDVIKPKIYHQNHIVNGTFQKGKHLKDISITFESHKKSFLLDLNLNINLLTDSYIEKFHHSNGVYTKRPSNHYETHCFYQGSIRNVPQSSVAVSTCNGVSGLIIDGQEIFYIQPVNKDKSDNLHFLVKDSDQKNTSFKCGTSDSSNSTIHHTAMQEVYQRIRRSIRGPFDSDENSRYIEMYLVVDLSSYRYHGENFSKTKIRALNIVNIVNMLYRPLDIYVCLVGLEVWSKEDRITRSIDPDNLLEHFLHYRKNCINPHHPNDNAQLLTGNSFSDGIVGKAKKGYICTHNYSAGVNSDRNNIEARVASTVAHELGHNLGMEHDKEDCTCEQSTCIMEPTSRASVIPTKWSSCSKSAVRDAFEMGMDYCLRNKPKSLYNQSCGNLFVEAGEDCDCGIENVVKTKCCNARTCKFINNAFCATGKCCDLNTCKLKAAGSPCRRRSGECDLPEYCTGKSEYCPDDVFLQNGHSCRGEAYCFQGKCKTHSDQCKLLWGPTGEVSNTECFRHANVWGNASGNCGYNWSDTSYHYKYNKCDHRDVLCGTLYCLHKNEKLMFWKDDLALNFPTDFLRYGTHTHICRAAVLDVGLNMIDPGMVPNGAKCDNEKMCVDQKCRTLAELAFPDCSHGCNGHGVCNSRGNCHCDNGYAPPYCDKKGKGGSVNSGPAQMTFEEESTKVALLILFLVVIPAICVAAFFAYRYRQTLKMYWTIRPRFSCRLPSPIIKSSKNTKPKQPPVHNDSLRQKHLSLPQQSVEISVPVLTGSTNRNSQAFISQQNPLLPGDESRQRKPLPEKRPPRPTRPVSAVLQKRDSFNREISQPVLLSTTNRDSLGLTEQNVPVIELQDARLAALTLNSHKVQRSQSDRPPHRPPPPRRPQPCTGETSGKPGLSRPQASEKPARLPVLKPSTPKLPTSSPKTVHKPSTTQKFSMRQQQQKSKPLPSLPTTKSDDLYKNNDSSSIYMNSDPAMLPVEETVGSDRRERENTSLYLNLGESRQPRVTYQNHPADENALYKNPDTEPSEKKSVSELRSKFDTHKKPALQTRTRRK